MDMQQVAQLKALLEQAKFPVFFGGAGMSTPIVQLHLTKRWGSNEDGRRNHHLSRSRGKRSNRIARRCNRQGTTPFPNAQSLYNQRTA